MTAADHVRVPKAGELVAGQLRRQIVRGELAEGTMLPPESVLMERFGVSRPTLREAFRMLEAEGLITVLRGARGGARVQVPEPASLARQAGAILQHRGASLKDVYEIRTLLETQAARMLAMNLTPEKIARLEELVAAEELAMKGDSPEDFLAADEALHLGVVELAGSKTLDLLVRVLYAVIESAIASSSTTPVANRGATMRRRTHRSHEKLVELVREGNAADITEYWHQHLEAVGEYLLQDVPAEYVVDLMS